MTKNDQNQQVYYIEPIGFIERKDQKETLVIYSDYIGGLKNLVGFSHLQVLWWFDKFADQESRKTLHFDKMPFDAPELGVFACRSPIRPNPIGLTTVKILEIDINKGLIKVDGIDADDQSPLLDIKPYIPSCDRVKTPQVAEWASQWPEWVHFKDE